MKALNLTTLIIAIIGGLDLGIAAFGDTDVITAMFGDGSGWARTLYALIGLSALWQLVPFFRAWRTNEVSAETDRRTMAS